MNTHDPTATPNAAFPNLTPTNHRVIGPATDRFNCIAWACGNVRQWWQPGPNFHWPVGAEPGNGSVGNLLAALAAVGYAPCPDGNLEPGTEKVAVYAMGTSTHTRHANSLRAGAAKSESGN